MIGHVFVVRSLIEAIGCDDLVVSTDKRGCAGARKHWWPALGWRSEAERSSARPEAKDGRWTRLASGDGDNPGRWLLDVGSRSSKGPTWVGEGVLEVLAAIASQADAHVPAGRLRRVALPVMGVAGGGLDDSRGEVAAELIEAAWKASRKFCLDVVLVARAASDYAALQSIRREDPRFRLAGELEGEAERLGLLVRDGRLALFMGAGTGVAAGLPLWEGLLDQLGEQARLPGGPAALRGLNPLDAAEVLRRAFQRAGTDGAPSLSLGERVAAVIGTPRRFALSHALLAALDVDEAVTTNFDDLYERAVEARGGTRPRVLLPQGERDVPKTNGWLLKLHGDALEPDTIVLDRRSFVSYDAKQRPLAAVLQALLLTRHVLVVGASMTDDNVIRLVHEVAVLKDARKSAPELGTVVVLQEDLLSAALWAPELRYVAVGGAMPEGEPPADKAARFLSAARQLDILLDRIAQKSARGTALLLDARYAALITNGRERSTALRFAELRLEVERWSSTGQRAGEWRELLQALGGWDARPDPESDEG